MCGFISLFSVEKPIEQNQFNEALGVLSHRGPDDEGIWISSDKRAALGHARLSIIDLEHGHQPLICSENRIHVVVNGEFYDYENIRRELIIKGHRFKTKSDSEILIALYKEYGTACLEHLRGEFAFVLYDAANQIIFAARDRFGIKPLYYTWHEGDLYFASEMKALFKMGVPCRWHDTAVYDLEHYIYRQDKTIFAGIQCVKPGHAWYGRIGQIKEIEYWDLDYIQKNKLPVSYSEKEYIEGFMQHFKEAVKLRMRADVPVGHYLSGGLDSCCVLAIMEELSVEPIDSFTACFDHFRYNEKYSAAEMAHFAGAKHNRISINKEIISQHFSDCVWHNETFVFNNNTVAKFVLSQYARDAGYKVILTGEGADEIAGGYFSFLRDMILYNIEGLSHSKQEKLLDLLHKSFGVMRLTKEVRERLDRLDRVKEILGYVPSMFQGFSLRGEYFRSLSANGNRQAYDPYIELFQSLNLSKIKDREPVSQSMYIWSKTFLPGLILNNLGDKMEMAHSIEGRVPFLDHKLVEYMSQLPVEMKIKGLTEKYIIREAFKHKIPKRVYQRNKGPFWSPPVMTRQINPMSQLMQEMFYSNILDQVPFYEKDKVIALFKKFPDMHPFNRRYMEEILMHLLSVCFIQARYNPGSYFSDQE